MSAIPLLTERAFVINDISRAITAYYRANPNVDRSFENRPWLTLVLGRLETEQLPHLARTGNGPQIQDGLLDEWRIRVKTIDVESHLEVTD